MRGPMNTKKRNEAIPYFFFSLLAFIFLVEVPVFVNYGRACFNLWDLGIYSQALGQISWSDLNPLITARGIRIFNDHFDPILLLAAPLAHIMDAGRAALWVEFMFVMAAAGVLFALATKREWNPTTLLLLLIVFLFGGTISSAVSFPVHPGAWAVFPLLLLSVSLVYERPIPILASLLFLFLFKEEFPFLGIALAITFFLRRRFLLGVGILTMSLGWLWLVFSAREAIVGPIVHYPSVLAEGWLESPIQKISSFLFSSGRWKTNLSLLAPFVPLAVWSFRSKMKFHWGLLALFVVHFGIRLVSQRWGYHYECTLAALLIGASLPLAFQQEDAPSRWVWASTLMLLLAVQAPFIGRYSGRTLFRGGLARCPADPVRLLELEELRVRLKNSEGTPVMAMGNLFPMLAYRGAFVLPMETRTLPNPPFWVALEKEPTGDPWPVGYDGIERMLNQFGKQYSAEVLLDGRFVKLVRFN